jgi:hypothetical protein
MCPDVSGSARVFKSSPSAADQLSSRTRMSKKTTKTTVKEEISEKENNPIASSSVVVKAESTNVKAEVKPAEEEDQSNWKPGQKYPTPSPGSGGMRYDYSLLFSITLILI